MMNSILSYLATARRSVIRPTRARDTGSLRPGRAPQARQEDRMRLSKTAIGLAAAATVAIACLAVWWHNGARRPTTVTFEPPYPQLNAAGDPILAVFDG